MTRYRKGVSAFGLVQGQQDKLAWLIVLAEGLGEMNIDLDDSILMLTDGHQFSRVALTATDLAGQTPQRSSDAEQAERLGQQTEGGPA